MRNKKFALMLFALIFLLFACQQQNVQQQISQAPVIGAEKQNFDAGKKSIPNLEIVSPKDNELIKNSQVTVELQAENFNLVPVGSDVKDGEGHFHVWLDSEEKISQETKFIFDNVVSGRHSIVAELVKSDNSPLSPKVSKTISIEVKSDFVIKVDVQQESPKEFEVEADDNGFYPNKLQAKIGDKIKINFKFRDDSIYYAGLDVKGPFPTIQYKLSGQQPVATEFTTNGDARIDSYWPSTGVHKATLMVEVEK